MDDNKTNNESITITMTMTMMIKEEANLRETSLVASATLVLLLS